MLLLSEFKKDLTKISLYKVYILISFFVAKLNMIAINTKHFSYSHSIVAVGLGERS